MINAPQPLALPQQEQYQEAIAQSFDATKHNLGRLIEEGGREISRCTKAFIDLQNETAGAFGEIAHNFLDSQKDVNNSFQSAWTPFVKGTGGGYWMGLSPRYMADMYARGVTAMTDSVAAGTRMATDMMYTGIEAARAATNYARQNSRDIARITSNTAGYQHTEKKYWKDILTPGFRQKLSAKILSLWI